MIDEEMAEEYAKPWKTSLAYVSVKEAYLAGLEAGKNMAEADLATVAYMQGAERYKPKWHDLRKDPNDLPKVNQKVLLQIKDEGRPIIDFYTRYGVWNFTNEYEAIAWCEIPKYTEG